MNPEDYISGFHRLHCKPGVTRTVTERDFAGYHDVLGEIHYVPSPYTHLVKQHNLAPVLSRPQKDEPKTSKTPELTRGTKPYAEPQVVPHFPRHDAEQAAQLCPTARGTFYSKRADVIRDDERLTPEWHSRVQDSASSFGSEMKKLLASAHS